MSVAKVHVNRFFLVSFIIGIVAITIWFCITLLFWVNFSLVFTFCASSPPLQPPQGMGKWGSERVGGGLKSLGVRLNLGVPFLKHNTHLNQSSLPDI